MALRGISIVRASAVAVAIVLAISQPSAALADPSFAQVRAVLAMALDSAPSAFAPFGVPPGTTGIAEYGVRHAGPTSPPNDAPKMPKQIQDACPECDMGVQFYQHRVGDEDPAHWSMVIRNGGSEGDVTFDQAEAFIRSSLGEAIPQSWKFVKTVPSGDPQQLTMYWMSPEGSVLGITYVTPSAGYHPQLYIQVRVIGHCPISCEWAPIN